MEQRLRSLLKGMIDNQRPKLTKAVSLSLAQLAETIPMGHSARCVELERICAEELDHRGGLWLKIAHRLFNETRTPWSQQNAEEMETLLIGEISADQAALDEIYQGKFPNSKGVLRTDELTASHEFATLSIRQELQLFVLREESARIPLHDQLAAARYAAVLSAWTKANQLFAENRDDYKPAVMEGVAAVEQLARLFVGNSTATLGDAIRDIRKSRRVPAPLLKGIEEIWAWSSGEPGVRHGATVDAPVDAVQAKYMLLLAEAGLLLLLDRDF